MLRKVYDPEHWVEELVAGPALEPVDLAFVKDQHLRVTSGAAEHAYIASLITVARMQAEAETGLALMTQRRAIVGPGFPCQTIVLPRPPLQAVVDIAYYDTAGVLQSLGGSPEAFQVLTGTDAARPRYGRILPRLNEVWPATQCGRLDAVRITFDAGFTSDTEPSQPVPADLVHGMLLLIAELYKQRSVSVQAMTVTPAVVRACDLWARYKVF